MFRVAILVSDATSLFELGCATELFALPRPDIDNWYRAQVVSFGEYPVEGAGGVALSVQSVDSFEDYQMLVIPAWPTGRLDCPKALIDSIAKLYHRGGRVLSFCSGAFLLAQTGLLDGRQATTHWRYAERFRERFAEVELLDNVLYTYSDNIGCSAGSAAALDLGLEVIRRDFDHRVANSVARRLVVSPHREGGQAQFVETPLLPKPNRFSATIDWALANLDKPIDVDALAAQAVMSRRSFDRHFHRAIGLSPSRWLVAQRVKLAQSLLESSREDMESIAVKSGFGSAMLMRHHFRASLSISPSEYRRRFFTARTTSAE